MRSLCALLSLFVMGCPEPGVRSLPDNNGSDTDEPGHTDPDSDVTYVSQCEHLEFPGFDAQVREDCVSELEVGTFEPVIEWRKSTFDVAPSSHWIMSAPAVAQFTDDNDDGRIDIDDVPDIVVVSFAGGDAPMVRVITGDGGREVWSTAVNSQITTGPAVADLDGDSFMEIVVVSADGLIVLEHTGAIKWQSRGLLQGTISGTSDVASIADMDGDGTPEIIVGSAIFDNEGNLLGKGAYGMGGVREFGNVGSASFAVDINRDGTQEVIVGNAMYDMDGSALWFNGAADGYPAVADFDGDGVGEIVVSGGGSLRMQSANGLVLWQRAIPGADAPSYGGPPTIADFDGDGFAEIGVASGSRYSVFEGDGTLLWQRVTNDSSSGNTGSTVFDFEGDGAAEVVYADQTKLWVFSGADGAVKLESEEHSNGTWLEYPVVADVDDDGHAEIVVVNTPQYGTHTGLYVFGDRDDSWMPAPKIWNQHAFFITNIDQFGKVPANPESNWPEYNNFRSADLTGNHGMAVPDLVLAQAAICELDCEEGDVWVWTHIGNQGVVDQFDAVMQISAELDDGSMVGLSEDSVVAAPALSYNDADAWRLTGLDWKHVVRLHFRAVADGLECDPDNDSMVIDGPFCAGR